MYIQIYNISNQLLQKMQGKYYFNFSFGKQKRTKQNKTN